MKTRLFILLSAMAFSLNAAFAQDFSSTGSDIMNTGSSLSSSVYGVGADGIDPMGSTASSPMRRGMTMGDSDDDDEESTWGDVGDHTPIGDAWSLLLFAVAAAGVIALRRRKLNADN